LTRLDNPHPVSPYSAFPLCNQGLVTAVSILITYIIVLMQFKVSNY
jgi:hypothetical protein